jgi:hypothetical protein
MFQISQDQTQWFHLYRVQKVFPVTFVLLACEEVNDQGVSSRLLDLRVLSSGQDVMGRSWRMNGACKDGKPCTRADCAKFLELHAKFSIANATKRGVDEIEFVESSREELAMAALFDEEFRKHLEAVAPTLFPRLAREMIQEVSATQTGLEFEELPDWPTRNMVLTE